MLLLPQLRTKIFIILLKEAYPSYIPPPPLIRESNLKGGMLITLRNGLGQALFKWIIINVEYLIMVFQYLLWFT